MSSSPPYLVADIGGTTTRVAAATAAGVLTSTEVVTKDNVGSDPVDLLVKVRNSLSDCKYGAIAIAGRVDTDEIQLTNRDWHFSRTELERRLGLRKLIVVNDFVAMAHAVHALSEQDLRVIRAGKQKHGAPRLVCGPGTGFGLAVVYSGRQVISTEAGHLRLGGIDKSEAGLLETIAGGNAANLIVEDLLSARGLCAIHLVLSGERRTSKAIVDAAEKGEAQAINSVEKFLQIFGRAVANLALLFDARGGVFIGGGVGTSLLKFYASPSFTRWFENHPTYDNILSNIPVKTVTHAVPGLIGAMQIVRNEFLSNGVRDRE